MRNILNLLNNNNNNNKILQIGLIVCFRKKKIVKNNYLLLEYKQNLPLNVIHLVIFIIFQNFNIRIKY